MEKSVLFTYALTYGAAASVYRPWIGFLIYVCFAIIKPDALWFWSVPEGNYSRIVAVALLIGWALRGFGNWKLGRATGLLLCLVGFFGAILLGAAIAPHADVGWAPVEPMAKTILPILVGISLIESWSHVKQLVWVIVLSQGFLAYEFNLTYYRTIFIPQDFNHAGLDNNGIAITMVTSVGLAFFLGMHAERWWQKGLALLLAGLMAHVVLFSHSRGGMVSLLITGATSVFLIPKRPVHYAIFAVAVLIVIRLAGSGVQERFATIYDDKKEGADRGGKRLEHWAACLDSMTKRPLGVGAASWPYTAPQYGLPRMAAHSTWLQVGAELGVFGLATLLGYYALCIGRLWAFTKDKRPVPDPWIRYIARMVIASLVGFLVSAQFVSIEGVELPYFIVLIGAGVLKVMSAQPAQQDAAAGEGQEAETEFAPAQGV